MIDPITLDVLRNRLDAVANAMQVRLLRNAVPVILGAGEDWPKRVLEEVVDGKGRPRQRAGTTASSSTRRSGEWVPRRPRSWVRECAPRAAR